MLARQIVRLSSRRTNLGSIYKSGHGPELQEPTGYLFSRKPGVKYEKEGWENLWYYGFYGAMVFGSIGLYFKPDTKVRTWARAEAEKRMEARGDILTYKHTDHVI
ncbi:hypothetical protein AYI70_g5157 [Smittium culicis]|uniref:NADH dehydrogenase [ubiquinone] 1 beta subcomplex subunit 11, mitochondrial n=2 Tax=Smittium culicis TaxID=133412 RepID=A0A1R1YR49_9FUNG|nr:hypothetical protein AYI70_g9844 [Smittium culicis]OMJ12513.1 hypothetical protein AYI70_g9071 [Smittium culicis]OMJ18767.1 hypothetical protein AYI70_g5157 [Smittium culicis]OMJ19890.1 hypothetical protein AYI69_g6437 [Smittium culicis]OMJ29362.1 hypothetical protein AYI69_g1151 [Smittium culicis]